jgi:DNA-binding NtrC family response regulator
MAAKTILVVDDEMGIRELLSEILYDEGYTVHLAESAAQARNFRKHHTIDLVLLDIWMPEVDGLTLLKEWAAQGALTMPVIMMSGHGTIETAVEATRIGALDFLEKPIALQKLLDTVASAIQHKKPLHLPAQTAAAASAPLAPNTPPAEIAAWLDQPLRAAREQFERAYFTHHLQLERGNVSQVAERAGLERTHLYRKLKQLGLKTSKS